MSVKEKIITIPTKPHFKKFLLKRYKAEPIKADEYSLIGKHIMAILLDKRSVKNENDQYTETISFALSDDISKRSPLIKNLVRINFYIQKDFNECLYTWVQAKIDSGINPYNATREFVEFFNFENSEYTHDAAQRAWLRHFNEESIRKKNETERKKRLAQRDKNPGDSVTK